MLRNETRLLRAQQATEIDLRTQERYGVDGQILMENAGQKAWAAVRDRFASSRDRCDSIVFIAGSGNNGGDALVMARQACIEGEIDPIVVTVKSELWGAVGAQWARLAALGVQRSVWELDEKRCRELIAGAELVVDGITGTGLGGPLRTSEARLVEVVNSSSAYRVAIDIPSGMRDAGAGDEPAIDADLTICTGYRKRLLYAPCRRERAGEIDWIDPGFPADADSSAQGQTYLVDPAEYPVSRIGVDRLSRDAHKGTRGRVVVIGGGEGTEGAPILSGIAALTAGAGMVQVITTEGSAAAGIAREPGIMWSATPPKRETFDWADAVVLGPGWVDAEESEFLNALRWSTESGTALVIDAAGLRLLAKNLSRKDREILANHPGEVVLTPHPGELAALCDTDISTVLSQPYRVLEELAEMVPTVTTILKGSASILRHRDGWYAVIDGRTPELAVAGSGDVLSGILGSYLAGTIAQTDRSGRSNGPGETTDTVGRSPSRGNVQVYSPIVDAVVEHLLRGRRLARDVGFFSATELAGTTIPVEAIDAYTGPSDG